MRLLHFTAEWCQPCRMMKPMIESLLEEYSDIEYVPIDIDQNVETAQDYQIQSIPTFILFDGDQAVRVTGAMGKSAFIDALGL